MRNEITKDKHFLHTKGIFSIFLALMIIFSAFTCAVPTWASYDDSTTQQNFGQSFEQKFGKGTDISSKNGWKVTLSSTSIVLNSKSNIPTITVKNAKGKVLTFEKDYTLYYYYKDNNQYKNVSHLAVNNVGSYKVYVVPITKSGYIGKIAKKFVVKPSKVIGITYSRISKNSISLTWNQLCKKNVKYYIYMYDGASNVYRYKTSSSSNSKTITSLSSDKVYSFKIIAKAVDDTSLVGDYSSTYSVKTLPLSFESTYLYPPKSYALSTTKYTYDGKVKKPSVIVKDSKSQTISPRYYTVKYVSGCKNVGEYALSINFVGAYFKSSPRILCFTIVPTPTKITFLRGGDNSFTIKWKEKTSQVTGYQMQFSTNSNFSNSVTHTDDSNVIVKKNLKNKQKYYVRVRTYKKVATNGNFKTFYSSWSEVKTVTTK